MIAGKFITRGVLLNKNIQPSSRAYITFLHRVRIQVYAPPCRVYRIRGIIKSKLKLLLQLKETSWAFYIQKQQAINHFVYIPNGEAGDDLYLISIFIFFYFFFYSDEIHKNHKMKQLLRCLSHYNVPIQAYYCYFYKGPK